MVHPYVGSANRRGASDFFLVQAVGIDWVRETGVRPAPPGETASAKSAREALEKASAASNLAEYLVAVSHRENPFDDEAAKYREQKTAIFSLSFLESFIGSYPEQERDKYLGRTVEMVVFTQKTNDVNGETEYSKATKQLRIVGVYDSKNPSADQQRIYMARSDLREIANILPEYQEIRVALKDYDRANAVKPRLVGRLSVRDPVTSALVSPFKAKTWEEAQQAFVKALNSEKAMLLIVLSFIVLLACFTILATLTLTVVEKTRDIGVVRALGGTTAGVLSIFLRSGLLIGFIGGVPRPRPRALRRPQRQRHQGRALGHRHRRPLRPTSRVPRDPDRDRSEAGRPDRARQHLRGVPRGAPARARAARMDPSWRCAMSESTTPDEPAVPSTIAAATRPVDRSAVPTLRARGLRKSYTIAGETLEVLKGVDLDVHEGEILAILGTSGSGKSTLLHVLGWLDRADAGTIQYEGRDRAGIPASERAALRNQVMGFVFQFYHLLPELTALENVLLPTMILHKGAAWRRHKVEAVARATSLLERVGLGPRAGHRPSQLSGGERQRVAIARALQNKPRFLLCDEPTGNLDGRTAADIRRLLWDLNRIDRQTLVVVTHDAKLAADAHRAVHLVDGRMAPGSGLDVSEGLAVPEG